MSHHREPQTCGKWHLTVPPKSEPSRKITAPKRGEYAESKAPRLRQAKKTGQLLPHPLEVAVNPMCVCGTVKDVIHGISCCSHCDDSSCKGISSGCDKCARYNAVTNFRTNIAYAREKNHG